MKVLRQWVVATCISFAGVIDVAGCAVGTGIADVEGTSGNDPAEGDGSATMVPVNSIRLTEFSDAEVTAQLDANWEHVADGEFVRYDKFGNEARLSVGRAGLAADVARLQGEIAALDAQIPNLPRAEKENQGIETLRTRLADLEGLLAEKNLPALTSNCQGDEFYANADFYYGWYNSGGEASAGRGLGFGPPIPSISYAAVIPYDNGWPTAGTAESYGDSTNPAYVSSNIDNFTGCRMGVYAWVSPSCPGAYLSLNKYGWCGMWWE